MQDILFDPGSRVVQERIKFPKLISYPPMYTKEETEELLQLELERQKESPRWSKEAKRQVKERWHQRRGK